jgi:hypothetical protein
MNNIVTANGNIGFIKGYNPENKSFIIQLVNGQMRIVNERVVHQIESKVYEAEQTTQSM